MGDKIKVMAELQGDALVVDVTFREPKLTGLACKLTIDMFVETLQSNGTNAQKTVLTEPFRADAQGHRFRIPRRDIDGFSYEGPHVRITPVVVVTVDDGVLWDTKERVNVRLPFPPRSDAQVVRSSLAEELNPKDQISFARNFGALPLGRKLLSATVLLVFGLGATGVLLASLYDQFTGQRQFFPADWSLPPIVLGIVAAVVGALVVYFSRKALLRGYMQVALRGDLPMITRQSRLRVSDLFAAASRTPLAGVRVRVVAATLECGEYVQRSGTDTNYVAFRRPVRGLILYDKTTAAVPVNVDLQQYFADELDFAPMFEALHPAVFYSARHGLGLDIQVQIIVPDLADFQISIPSEKIDARSFAATGEKQ